MYIIKKKILHVFEFFKVFVRKFCIMFIALNIFGNLFSKMKILEKFKWIQKMNEFI